MTLLAFAYPLIAHLSIFAGHVEVAVYFLGAIFFLPLLFGLIQQQRMDMWRVLCALCGLVVLILAEQQAELFVQSHPILIYGFMFLFFSSTLSAGSVPLITRFAILIRGEEASELVKQYGRRVTVAWALFFLVMIAVSLLLSIYASLETWSWFANFFSYLLIGVMFVIEFAVRRMVLKEQVDYSFRQFIQGLKGVDYRRLIRGWRG